MTASCFAAMIEQKAGTTHKVTRVPAIIPATIPLPEAKEYRGIVPLPNP